MTSNPAETLRAVWGASFANDVLAVGETWPDVEMAICRDIPDLFEETMPEIFLETAPGNLTFNEQMQKLVMRVFDKL